jgi:aminomethyltransferase
MPSGTHSPSLERPLGMGYVEAARAANGTALEIEAGSTMLAARVTARPFYTRGSHRS